MLDRVKERGTIPESITCHVTQTLGFRLEPATEMVPSTLLDTNLCGARQAAQQRLSCRQRLCATLDALPRVSRPGGFSRRTSN